MLDRIRSFIAVFSFKKQSAAITRLPIGRFIRPKVRSFRLLRTGVLAVLSSSVLTLTLAGCDNLQGTPESVSEPRPVTIMRLRERDFARETRLTGSVGLYREEKIGFEVNGRLLSVLDLGREVTGPAYDERSTQVRQGDVIARLDDKRYRFRVRALEARLRSVGKELEAQQIAVDKVAPANLKTAQANLRVADTEISTAGKRIEEAQFEKTRAEKDLARQQKLMRTNAGRQKGLDDARAVFDSAGSRVEQFKARLQARRQALEARRAAVSVARANISLKRAQLESKQGRIAELQEKLEEAREDLNDTILRAPFTGRITAIHAVQGAVVSAGSAVATLSLLDPIQIQLEVSADTDRRIRTGDKAWLFPKDPIDPDGARLSINAVVFEKGSVANPKTRTFRITLMTRNERRKIEHLVPETKGLPLVEDFLPVARRFKGEPGPLFVPVDSVYVENGRTYVLRLPDIGFQSGSARGAVGKHIPEKIKVSMGNEYMGVIKWNFRSLADPGSLKEGDFLVLNPKKEHLAGLAIGRAQWLLRPGELVPVKFAMDATPRGFYVPTNAITKIAGESIIFSVADGRAKKVRVSVHDIQGEYQRIEGSALRSGMPVVVSGVHYVSDGQRVSVLTEENRQR